MAVAVAVGWGGPGVRSWRLAAVVADTWKGFSNLAGLSSTVTFVTVTHAILEPQPTKAKNQARRWSVVQRRASVKNRARTRACWSRRGLTGERLVVHICACVSGTAHLRGSGGRAPMSPRPVAPCFVCAGREEGVQAGKHGQEFSIIAPTWTAPLLRAHRRASLGAAGRHPWGWRRIQARRSTCLLLLAVQRRRVESLVLGALSSSPVHRALVLVLGTNIAVLLDCSSRLDSVAFLTYLLTYFR